MNEHLEEMLHYLIKLVITGIVYTFCYFTFGFEITVIVGLIVLLANTK